MIKNILLVVMTILTLMSFVFAYVQKLEADNQRELAIALKQQAVQSEIKVTQSMMVAEQARSEADKQRSLAIECESSKKR
jgi:cbb3-type cytochrome oxidase subunit 3